MKSGSERWDQADALFEAALDLPAETRAEFLSEACGDDIELRRELEDLFRAHEESDDYWRRSGPLIAGVHADLGSDPEAESKDPERVGPYRLVECIGRGGMGTVYLAERDDGEFERRVAVKLLRRGLDTDDIVRRFRAERQILASLNHPNIARLVDGGSTEDGRPYLVMEYVEGSPITEYCDDQQLPIPARLRLFETVLGAVGHAHRHLVIHRDIKPSNILITDSGDVKLLDFGIAKLLDDGEGGSETTRTGVRLLTPGYASPEQLAGAPVTTASDVYQLGILLCELLAGNRPSEVGGLASGPLEAQNTEATPTRPSQLLDPETAAARGQTANRLARRLEGDLDTIVLKALRREPARRYSSVEPLIDDIERHLTGRPITARPPTWSYRTGKLLRRRPWLVPVTAAAALLIAGYLFTVDRHTRQLETERNIARAEAERAQEVQNFLVQVLGSPNPYRPADVERGSDVTVIEALGIGADRGRRDLADRPALLATILGAVADVYQSLDLPENARPLREEALEIQRDIGGVGSSEFVTGLRQLARIEWLAGEHDSARVLVARGLTTARSANTIDDSLLATLLIYASRFDSDQGEFADAEVAAAEAIRRLEGSATESTALLAQAYKRWAFALSGLGDVAARLEAANTALELSRRAYGEGHPETAVMLVDVADALDSSGRDEEAVALYNEAISALEHAFGPAHDETLNARNNLTTSLLALGEFAEAERVLVEILELRIAKKGENHPEVARSLQNLAVMVEGQGRFDEAESLLERARAALSASLGAGHFQTAYPLLTRSGIQIKRSNYRQAEVTAREATQILRAALPKGYFATAMGECRWGRALAGQNRAEEARPLLESAAGVLEKNTLVPHTYELECLGALVRLYEAGGDVELAVPLRARVAELETLVAAS